MALSLSVWQYVYDSIFICFLRRWWWLLWRWLVGWWDAWHWSNALFGLDCSNIYTNLSVLFVLTFFDHAYIDDDTCIFQLYSKAYLAIFEYFLYFSCFSCACLLYRGGLLFGGMETQPKVAYTHLHASAHAYKFIRVLPHNTCTI